MLDVGCSGTTLWPISGRQFVDVSFSFKCSYLEAQQNKNSARYDVLCWEEKGKKQVELSQAE